MIEGASGCGKSFSFEYMLEEYLQYGFDQALLFDGDALYDDCEYAPFKNTISDHLHNNETIVTRGIVEAAKDLPGGNTISFLFDTLFNLGKKNNLDILNEDERMILNYLKRIVRNKNTVILFDNIHQWDRRSLQLLKHIITSANTIASSFPYKVKLVMSVTTNQAGANVDLIEKITNDVPKSHKLSFPTMSLEDFSVIFQEKAQRRLPKKQLRLLYNLINGHLKILFEVARDIRFNSFDFDETQQNSVKYFQAILSKRLQEFGATGDQIANVLEYASILGKTFSCFELLVATDSSRSKLEELINDSNSLNLTEDASKNGYIKFAHSIVHEIFKSRVDSNHIDYYYRLSICLKEMKPSQYLRRARYMLAAGREEEAGTLYILEFLQQLRNFGNIPQSLILEAELHLDSKLTSYLTLMQSAYYSYSQKDYPTTLTTLDMIPSYYRTELLAERNILKLRCFSKQLASEPIVEEIARFTSCVKSEKFNGEKEVRERFIHALITANAHLREFRYARDLEEELLSSLEGRMKYDSSAEMRVYSVLRNANAIHGAEVSLCHVRKAVEYFEKLFFDNNCFVLRQYYTSLINYSAMLIINGEFMEAVRQTRKALSIEKCYPDFPFPRPQILRNNYALASFLSGKATASECVLIFEEVLGSIPQDLAERIFYASNLAIFLAISGSVTRAYRVLFNEAQKHDIDNDKEGIYQYRTETNLAIFQYLLGDKTAYENLKRITNGLDNLINGSFFKKKNQVILEIMKDETHCNPHEWLHIVHSFCHDYQGKPWDYFGLGFAFAALCDWGV